MISQKLGKPVAVVAIGSGFFGIRACAASIAVAALLAYSIPSVEAVDSDWQKISEDEWQTLGESAEIVKLSDDYYYKGKK